MNLKDVSLSDLAASICDRCRKNGIEVVLSGGACVSIYTQNKYISYDLDFVLVSSVGRKPIKSAMKTLGFNEDGRHFRHPDTPFLVEFLSPPLSVGQEPVREIREIQRGKRILRLLSPTDCVKDRLAAFYHWNDRQSLDQAILVCRDAKVDFQEVKRWSIGEGMKNRFGIFEKARSGEKAKVSKLRRIKK
jgi:hypothetical protein